MAEETTSPHTSGTVKLPGFGQVKSKTAVMVGGGAVVLLLVYFYMKQRAAAQAGSGVATGSVTDPGGNTCTPDQINPSTGYCLGSAQDTAAMSTQASISAAQGGNQYTGQPFTGAGTQAAGSTGFFANNAEWAQAVYLALGSNGTDVIAQAVSAYLAGGVVTTNQVGTIEEAIAVEGMPPVAGPNGMPPAINSGTGTGSGVGTPPPPPPPPPPVPKPQSQTGTVHSATTGRSGQVNTTNAGQTWNYIGVQSHVPEPRNQTGTVHSATTGLSARVTTADAGLHWTYAGK